ncbi:MobB [Lacticaseibacillus paracasei subsp. paracasei Lpp7]|uniref:MobB n=2 Tax=Bacilli TaxID=91061 RepID=A0A8E0IES2_LACPA|nr:MobB [Lacticaseibacillus paracasei subsp. paracasei Lpp7]
MSQNEELAKQILTAYANGQVDLTNVPDLQKMVKEAAAQQMAHTYSTTDFHAKQEEALAHEKAWYHQEIDRILQEKLTEIEPKTLKGAVTDQLKQQLADLEHQQAEFEATVERAKSTGNRQFWQSLAPNLAGFAVCLLLVAVIFFVLEKLIYQGIWNGWGLRLLTQKVIEIQPNHPYGAGFLGVIGLVALATAIYASFWLLVRAVRQLVDFKPSKLLFWKKQDNTRW